MMTPEEQKAITELDQRYRAIWGTATIRAVW